MNSLRLLAALAVAAVGLLLAGAVYSLVVGVLLTSQRVLPSLVVLVLVSAVIGWLVVRGIRGAGNTATTYW